MLAYLSVDIICSEKRTVFQALSFEEQIMSKDKYPSIFSPHMEAIVFIILQIFFATLEVLKIGEYSQIFPSFSWGIFGHVRCLDQLHASERYPKSSVQTLFSDWRRQVIVFWSFWAGYNIKEVMIKLNFPKNWSVFKFKIQLYTVCDVVAEKWLFKKI